MTNQIIKGSLGQVAKEKNQSLAMGFMSVAAFVMVDVSASMKDRDCAGGLSRYDAACEQLKNLQNEQPGEIAVGYFSNTANFSPSGVPVMQGGTTDLCAALRLLKQADGCGIRLVIISDGEPDDDAGALKLAGTFQSKIDTIFVGAETGRGREFLRELAARTGGVSITQDTDKINLLSENITRLIAA